MNSNPVLTQELLEELRVRIGLAFDDPSQDDSITAAYVSAVHWMEQYLDRFLVAGQYTETKVHKAGYKISLKGYPIVTIDSVTSPDSANTTILDFHVDKENGVFMFDGFARYHELVITYTSDDPLIGPLKYVMLQLFDTLYAAFASSEVSVAGGAVKAISSDGARVEFDTSSSSGSAGGIDPNSGLPNSLVGILNMYRREWC